MKAAIAIWEDRIAPVFDVASQIHLVETGPDGTVVAERRAALDATEPLTRARRLAALGVELLICGAISRPLQDLVVSQGVHVMPFVAGDLGEVLAAWRADRLRDDRFAMPGCCGQRRGRRRGDGPDGRSQGGRGRGGGPAAGGPGGRCVCPDCGHAEDHERGTPCQQKRCPRCGTPLVRKI